mgnify:CR=1 FL=1
MLNVDGALKSNRCNAAESVARSSVWGVRAWIRVGGSSFPEGSNGIRILETTCPVEQSAALSRPSVPAE